ncbi:hypothetical protein BGX23_011362 [Mortierella sp. AD031]|nr:hypothetical protein BGX23_011362 [Mortierella sp. AD031]KAG0214962.1 hypothetical protein BGX33_001641 [Mortierella sp. NVP41]
MAEKVNNTLHSVIGGAKEPLGRAVGSEAQAQTRSAAHATQAQAQKTQQHAQGVTDDVTGRIKSTVGAATGNHKMEAEGRIQNASGNIRKAANQ